MNRDAGRLLAPLLAVAVFVYVLLQTGHALQDSGVWRFGARRMAAPPADPFVELDGTIARVQSAPFDASPRDPFVYGPVERSSVLERVVRRLTPPAPPERPVLTAVVFDADPSAVVRWKGREYSVRTNGIFDEFVVMSISREQVVLKRGSETIVLQRKPQGD